MGRQGLWGLLAILGIGIIFYLFNRGPQSPVPGTKIPEQLIWTPQKDIDLLNDSKFSILDKQAATVRLWIAGHESAADWTTKILAETSPETKKQYLVKLFEAGSESEQAGLTLLDEVIGPLKDPELERLRLIQRHSVSPSDTLELLEQKLKTLRPDSNEYFEIALSIYRTTKSQTKIQDNFFKIIGDTSKSKNIEGPLLLRAYKLLITNTKSSENAILLAQKNALQKNTDPKLRVSLLRLLEMKNRGLENAAMSQIISELPPQDLAALARATVYRCQKDRDNLLTAIEAREDSSDKNNILSASLNAARSEISRSDPCIKDRN